MYALIPGLTRSTALDAYTAEAPGEFFAVISEYFFESPKVFNACYPEVYAELRAFYRQDPLDRITAYRR